MQLAKHLNGWLTRWPLILQAVNFVISYRPGNANANADRISREAWSDNEIEEEVIELQAQTFKEGEVFGQQCSVAPRTLNYAVYMCLLPTLMEFTPQPIV